MSRVNNKKHKATGITCWDIFTLVTEQSSISENVLFKLKEFHLQLCTSCLKIKSFY